MYYKNWKCKKGLDKHIGGQNNAYNLTQRRYQDLVKQENSIQIIFEGQNNRA
jgi:hypothetical protein